MAGHGYQYDSLSGVATYAPGTCGDNMTLAQLNVGFNINGVEINGSGVSVPEGVTVYENTSSMTVTDVIVDSTVQGITYWSGYEAHYVSGGSTQKLYASNFNFDVPIVSHNANCYHASPYQCEMSVWAGLSNSGGGGGFLIQSGVDIKVPCTSTTSCSSTVYTAWWEWVPHNAAQSCGSAYPVYNLDEVVPIEKNGLFSGGNGVSGDYQAYVQDVSQNWICGSTWQNIGSTAYYAQSIIETPSNGCCPIPTSWGTLTLYGNALATTTSTWTWFSASGVVTSYDTMYNYCTALGTHIYNINVGTTITSGNYNQSYNNNCDF